MFNKIILTTLVFLASCDNICGDLTDEKQKLIDSAQSGYPQYKIKPIPCEYYYIDIEQMSTGYLDTNDVRNIHKILFDSLTNIGWREINIFSIEDKYLFSHFYKGKIYIKGKDNE